MTDKPEAVAYLHTLHMELGQTNTRLLAWDGHDEYEPSRTAFGLPGRDYSEEYPVTTIPLYAHPPQPDASALVEALNTVAPLLDYLPHPHCVTAIDAVRAALSAWEAQHGTDR